VSRASSELSHLFRALKAPAAARALPKLADRARAEEWSFERFAEVLLKTEIDSRDSHGGQARIKAARFPARKTLEDFDFAFQASIRRDAVLHLGQLDFLAGKENVVLLGPPGTGKDPFGDRARNPRLPGRPPRRVPHRHRMGRPPGRRSTLRPPRRRARQAPTDPAARRRRGRIRPLRPAGREPHVHARLAPHERASLVVTSNKPFSAWGEIFGDDVVAAAMIDRLVHHAEILALKGDSYRLRDRDLARAPSD
jgi:IstB-like ATP binding protein